MNDVINIILCGIPSTVAFWCMVAILVRWKQRTRVQKTMAWLLAVIFVGSIYFYALQVPAFHRAHRLDWFLSGVLVFIPATYYLYICRLTGTGGRAKILRAYLVPSILTFISLVLYMLMGDQSAGDFLERVKVGGNYNFDGMPVFWKVKYIYTRYIFRLVAFAQVVLVLAFTYRRIARFHKDLKDFFADAETRLFRSGNLLRISGVLLLLSLVMMTAYRYSMYADDIYYVVIMDVLLTVSLVLVTFYSLRQPITAEDLAVMAEETKNMGQALKTKASLNDRLLASIEDEFFTDPEVTLMSLSEKLGTNTAYLSDIIHINYGLSFADFVNDLRIKKAIKEMREIPINTPLTKVARFCGYTTYSQFAHNFEEFAHLTPSEWMKRYR